MKMLTLIITVMVFITSTMNAQNLQLTGTIKDEYGQPVPYASITFKKNGLLISKSNKLGNFIITNASNGDTLVCSHTNYIAQTEIIEQNNVINFFLTRCSPTVYQVMIKATEKREIPPKAIKKEEEEYEYFTRVEIPASYPNGDKNIPAFFKTAIEKSGTKTYSGCIKLRLIIAYDGTVKAVQLVKGIINAQDDFIIQQATKMLWRPAMQNGRNIESTEEINICFN